MKMWLKHHGAIYGSGKPGCRLTVFLIRPILALFGEILPNIANMPRSVAMKSEERHRLQESELEHWGKRARDYWDSFCKNYGKMTLIALAAIVVVGGGTAIWTWIARSSAADRWEEMFGATFNQSQSTEEFATLAEKYSDYSVGQWAGLLEAESSLRSGIFLSRSDPVISNQDLDQALTRFKALEGTKDSMIEERRLFGLARCLETMAGVVPPNTSEEETDHVAAVVKNLGESVAVYDQLVQQFPDSILTPTAKKRSQVLKADLKQFQTLKEKYPGEDLQTELQKTNGPIGFYVWYRTNVTKNSDSSTLEPDDTSNKPFPGHPDISRPSTTPTPPEKPLTDEDMMQQIKDLHNNSKPKPTKPETTTPDPKKPETTKPESTKPEPAKPDPAKPETTKPDPKKPEPAKPDPAKPETTKPETTTPNPKKPEPAKPEPTKPEPKKPEPAKPETTKPETTKPEPGKPDSAPK